MGVIYILTNPSFPEYIKIGYADNLTERLKQLNRSETIPYSFRAYATYEMKWSHPCQGPAYWTYQGKTLADLRDEIASKKTIEVRSKLLRTSIF